MYATAMKSILSEERVQPSRTSSAIGGRNTTSRHPGWAFLSCSCMAALPPPGEAHPYRPHHSKMRAAVRLNAPTQGPEKTEPHSGQGPHDRQVSWLPSFMLLTCPRQITAGQSPEGRGSFWFQGRASPALGKQDRSNFCASYPTPHPALNSLWLPTAPNRNFSILAAIRIPWRASKITTMTKTRPHLKPSISEF